MSKVWENYQFSPFARHRFLSRILTAEDRSDARRIEGVIAATRMFMAAVCLLATLLDPTLPTGGARLSYAWLALYVVYALLVLLVLRRKPALPPRFRFLTHSGDLVAVTAFTLFTQGPHTAFYALFLFVLLSAAFRWGLMETVATALAAGALIFGENALFEESRLHQLWRLGTPIVPNLTMPAVYLFIQGLIAGIMAVEIRRLHAEQSTIARIMAGLNPESGLIVTLRKLSSEMIRIFGAREILVAVEETGILHLFQAMRRHTGETSIRVVRIEQQKREKYFFAVAPPRSPAALPVQSIPREFRVTHPCQSLLVDTADLGHLRVRVFLLDSAPEMQGGCGLHFLGALFSRVAPAVFEIYRTRRMREEISALERASLARELHDGTLQTLIALEVELEVLRKKSEQAGSGAGGQLEAIQQTLRDEIVNLRRLMQRYKRIDWGAGECVQALRCVAAQLESESGIATSFESDVDALHVPGQVRREILRIVQEALVNVRKHSGARSAKVQLTCSNGHYRIAIRDDGRGFGFEGRRTLLDLDAEGRGPEILKERVRLIGGELEIASVPGGGSCVEVRVPRGKVAAG